MLDSGNPFDTDFPAVSYADWRQRVEAELGSTPFDALTSRLREGLILEPLYPGDGPAQTAAPIGRDPGWRIAEELPSLPAELDAASSVAEEIWCPLPAGHPAAALGGALESLGQKALVLQAAGDGRAAARALAAAGLLESRAVRVVCDPLGTLASEGRLPLELESALGSLGDLAAAAEGQPAARCVLASAVPYHEAGGGADLELAFARATVVTYLRAMEAAGLSVARGAACLRFAFGLGSDIFLEIAKLRAARRLWGRVLAVCGVEGPPGIEIHTRSGAAGRTARDPRSNMLRATAEGFAAAVGGADSLALLPHDACHGTASIEGRRLALLVQQVLAAEGFLGRVADPAAGSAYLESLTGDLERAAWEGFREVEGSGGMAGWLRSGKARERLRQQAAERQRQVATGRWPIVGVSIFADLAEAPPPTLVEFAEAAESVQEAPGQAQGEPGEAQGEPVQAQVEPVQAQVEPVEKVRWAGPFEALRAASDRYLESTGARPRVFLARLGPLAEHGPRADFARRLLASGGFEAVGQEGADGAAIAAAFAASGARVAVLCGTEAAYDDGAAEVARQLRGHGAERLLLAGKPGERTAELAAVGVDGYLYQGADALAILGSLATELEVVR